MPSEKPLPDNDDIIDLTDLVEEDASGSAPAGKENSADASFEQELDDLFGDVAPEAPPAGAPETDGPDEDIIDLQGLELAEPEAEGPTAAVEPAPAAAAAPAPADDLMDLAGLGLDEPETPPAEPVPASPPPAFADAAVAAPEMDITDFDTPDEQTAEPEDVAAMPKAQPAPPVKAPASDEDAMDISDLSGLSPLAEPTPTPTPAPAPAASAPTTAPAASETIDLDALDQLILTARGPVPEVEEAPSEDALAAWNARLDALEAATTALTSQIQDMPQIPDSEAMTARLEAVLTARFDALRAELPSEPPPPVGPDLEALRAELTAAIEAGRPDRESLIADLRAALAPDFDALRQSLPDTENFITPTSLKEALTGLREGLAVDLAAVLETAKKAAHDEVQKMGDALAERLAVLEAARGDPDVLAERLTALEADRIDPAALAEQVRQSLLPAIPDVNAAVTGVREGLAVDLAAVLQTAKQAARDEAQAMADALADRIATLETDRIDPEAVAERVKEALLPAAKDREAALHTAQQALAGLDARVTTADFQAALTTLRTEIDEDISRRIPQAAAAILRREIAALIKEFG